MSADKRTILRRVCNAFSLLLLTAAPADVSLAAARASGAFLQSREPGERIHGVLLQSNFRPPLRSAGVILRYSPDGNFLMLQDSSGIYILQRQPLELRMFLEAPFTYRARFSADSKTLAVVSLTLRYGRWDLSSGKKIDEKDLHIPDGCLDATLSPDSKLLACYRPDFALGLYELASDQWIFSGKLQRPGQNLGFFLTFVPLATDTAFAGPFGFLYSKDMTPLANRGILRQRMSFSPDSETFIAGDREDAIRVDVSARKKARLPGGIRSRMTDTFLLTGEDHALVIEREKKDGPELLSLANGRLLASLAFKADHVRLASNPRFAILSDIGAPSVRIFDLQKNRPVEVPDNIGADVYENELAVFNERGELFLHHVGEPLPFASLPLPYDNLPVLRSASLTPSLDELALSVDGAGALFRIADGHLVQILPRFSSVNFVDSNGGFLLIPPRFMASQTVLHLNSKNGATEPAWSARKAFLQAGGTVLFEYSFENPFGQFIPAIQEGGIPFLLRALDPATGKELWKRSFLQDPPIPFADPQGDRFVLGWKAESEGAKNAAKLNPETKENLKKAKLDEHDTFFEVLDALSGKSFGGALVQAGAGAYSFDAAFSEGDALILQKDGVRISVYSLRDGQLKTRLVGSRPAANAQSNLFCLVEGGDRLALYDLSGFAKLDEQIFPNEIAYTHFSADGKRLFVLTAYQQAFLLDLSNIRNSKHPASSSAAPRQFFKPAVSPGVSPNR